MTRTLAALLLVAACATPTSPEAIDVAADVRPREPVYESAADYTVPTVARRVPPTTRASRGAVRPPRAAAPAPTGDIWWRLALCESGGNTRAVSSSGKFRGAFQHSLSTWRASGGVGDPINFDYETQKAVAMRTQRLQGWGAWPTCARKLGLI